MVQSIRRETVAFVVPFAVFLGFLGLAWLIQTIGRSVGGPLPLEPKYWIFPLQTAICAGLLAWFWKAYPIAPLVGTFAGLAAGLLALAIWISPQAVLGFPARTEGFNPEIFPRESFLYVLTVAARLARLAIVVPIMEEIFWRGFLMRYLIDEKFTEVPFGTFRRGPFLAVAALFMLAHEFPDWPAAFVTGLIYNAVAVRTRSLWACIIAHATTNLGLGAYIMSTRQWGFW